MAPAGQEGVVYSATYSNVPVYELNVNGNHVMRRRADDWINATHILKVADLDKPARTRVLEKEVQLDIHEKVQGGYGKYQGTWVPQEKAEVLARKYNVYPLLKPILVFKLAAGDKSPPPAPKHTTAASNKPKVIKPPPVKKAPKPKAVPAAKKEEIYDDYDNISDQLHDDDSPDNSTIGSESVIEEDYSSRKRKRADQNKISKNDQEHRIWADSLLDYFMLHDGESGYPARNFPEVPPNVEVNRPIDDEGHTALHWASSMGDVEVIKDLLNRHADVAARNVRGETPLIRGALFANCYDRGTWQKLVYLLQHTIMLRDSHGGTIFHHIAYTTISGSRASRAKHYLEILLNKFHEMVSPTEFEGFLNAQDRNGDTAFHIAVRHSRRCMKVFQSYGLAANIRNANGETVESYIQSRSKSKTGNGGANSRLDTFMQSSSPVQAHDPSLPNTFSPSRFPASTNLFLPTSSLRTSSSQTFNRSLSALMSTGITDFLQAGESELADKDQILSDTTRALHRSEADLSLLRQRCLALTASLDSEGPAIASLEADEARLCSEAEKLEEQIQHRSLHKAVHQEETSHRTLNATDLMDKEEERRMKLRLALDLDAQQRRRVALAREIMDASADAGMGPKGEQMKGIIVQTLGVGRERFCEDVEAMVEHLEKERL